VLSRHTGILLRLSISSQTTLLLWLAIDGCPTAINSKAADHITLLVRESVYKSSYIWHLMLMKYYAKHYMPAIGPVQWTRAWPLVWSHWASAMDSGRPWTLQFQIQIRSGDFIHNPTHCGKRTMAHVVVTASMCVDGSVCLNQMLGVAASMQRPYRHEHRAVKDYSGVCKHMVNNSGPSSSAASTASAGTTGVTHLYQCHTCATGTGHR
jgi:hypothetical protein